MATVNNTCAHKLLKKQMSGQQVWYACQNWIPVSRRIPDFEEPVWGLLTFENSKGYALAIVMRGDGEDGWLWHVCNEWSSGMVNWPMDIAYADFECDDDYNVQYWLPLSAIPLAPAECGQKFKAEALDGKVKVVTKWSYRLREEQSQ